MDVALGEATDDGGVRVPEGDVEAAGLKRSGEQHAWNLRKTAILTVLRH